MRLISTQQSREVDELACEAYGLSSEILMEAAGIQAARECQQNFYPELSRGLTAIFCGPGHNGSDGLVMARHLHSMGYRNLLVVLAAPAKKRTDLFKLQLKRVELHGLRVIDGLRELKKREQINSATLLVDALFGVGFKNKLKEEYVDIFEKINSIKVPIVSLDCPSGLNCDTGLSVSGAIKAHTTFTFGLAKPGFFVADGPLMVGKLRVLPIGYPFECLRGLATTHFIFNDKLAKRYLPQRKNQTYKSNFGRLVVIAGSDGMWGAGILTAQSAYRMGAGYVYWASESSPITNLEYTPEVLIKDLYDDEIWNTNKIKAYAIGPGLVEGKSTASLIRKLRDLKADKVVIDAGAFTTCVNEKLFPLPKSWVVTPHVGELSRLIKRNYNEIEADRYGSALLAAKTTGCHVLLKGYRSIHAYENRCMVINSGNSALAKAGSGDVLTGMIGSLLAQGLDTVQATATAAFIHGRLADEWVKMGNDKRALNPNDLKDQLPVILNRISQSTIF